MPKQTVSLLIILLFLSFNSTIYSHMNHPLICGHRGFSSKYPENTLSSFRACLNNNAQAIELDIHQCLTGELVVIHDDSVDRTTNGHGLVKDLTLKQLKDLTIAQNEKIPTLEEVFELIDGKISINIEIKDYTHSLVDELIPLIEKYHHADKIIISSFGFDILKYFADKNKHYKLAYLTEDISFENCQNKLAQIHAFSWNPDFKSLTPKNCMQAHNSKYQIWTWTIDNNNQFAKALEYNVDAIITNDPNKLNQFLNKK